MTINELKVLLETIEALGHSDARLYYDKGQDGITAYTSIRFVAKKVGDQRDPRVMLLAVDE